LTPEGPPPAPEPPLPGLCGDCLHAAVIISAKGSRFVRCELSFTDPRYARFPVLPVEAAPARGAPGRVAINSNDEKHRIGIAIASTPCRVSGAGSG
jgi:hypothetical protein